MKTDKLLIEKLDTYKKTKKGAVRKVSSFSTNGKLIFSILPVLSLSAFGTLNAQCSSPKATNSLVPENGGPGNGVAFDVTGDAINDFVIYENGPTIGLRLQILNTSLSVIRGSAPSSTDNYASVLRVTNSTVSNSFAGNNWINAGNDDPYLNYGINGSQGQFSNGTTGFVIFRNSSNHVGFFQLNYAHIGSGVDQVSIPQGAINTIPGPIIPGNCSSLPVELTNFQVKEINNNVLLEWETESEIDNAGFEIQRSPDGTEFKKIGFIEGTGNSSRLRTYQFKDSKLKPSKTYYYRLKQVDYNGRFSYSDIVGITLKHNGFKVGDIFPNPSIDGIIKMEVSSGKNEIYSFSIFNVDGTLLRNFNKELNKGFNIIDIEISEFHRGTFVLKIFNSEQSIYQKIIKQ